jgi:hypothetical protein
LIRVSAWGFALLGLFLLLGYLVHDSQLFFDTAVSTALDGFWLTRAGGVVAILTDVLGPVLPIAMFFALVAATYRVLPGAPGRVAGQRVAALHRAAGRVPGGVVVQDGVRT